MQFAECGQAHLRSVKPIRRERLLKGVPHLPSELEGRFLDCVFHRLAPGPRCCLVGGLLTLGEQFPHERKVAGLTDGSDWLAASLWSLEGNPRGCLLAGSDPGPVSPATDGLRRRGNRTHLTETRPRRC